MNISYNWLGELIETDLTAEEAAAQLTRVGLAVEGIHPFKNDLVLDIDLTSNRPDCLSHLGVARELSVITGKPVITDRRSPERLPDAPFPNILAADIVKIEDPDLCYRFTARIIRNVKIGPSPQWLADRLEALGERSINNVADITNYVMLELGQPMHAFDLDKLAEKRIVVRRAANGENITTLDEAERELDDSMLMICDAEKPVAVGGVMGGLGSSITDATVDVLLEVAYFDRSSIRKTSRKLGLATEASYRFERGVDIENLKPASDRATELICELAGGEAGEFVDVYPKRLVQNEVDSRDISGAVKRLTGLQVEAGECVLTLEALGIALKKEGSEISDLRSQTFIAPTWRHDIAIEEDLVEEIARHAGYENVKDELPPAYGAGEYQVTEVRKKLIRRTLADLGFDEAIGYSFIDMRHDGMIEEVPELLGGDSYEPYVTLKDSVIEGAVRMRTTLVPGLLDAVRLNFNHQRKDLRLFELGRVFSTGNGELPKEREVFGIVVTGGQINEDRAMAIRELDFFDAKGAVEAALEAAGAAEARFDAEDVKHLRRGQSASITVGERKVGFLGRLSEEIAANYKFKQPVYVGEIDLQSVLEQAPEPAKYAPLPKFPSVVRDVSFVVDRGTSYESIKRTAETNAPKILRSVDFVDVFEGKSLGEEERSLTIRFSYRAHDRTLVEEEVNEAHQAVLAKLSDSLGVSPRN